MGKSLVFAQDDLQESPRTGTGCVYIMYYCTRRTMQIHLLLYAIASGCVGGWWVNFGAHVFCCRSHFAQKRPHPCSRAKSAHDYALRLAPAISVILRTYCAIFYFASRKIYEPDEDRLYATYEMRCYAGTQTRIENLIRAAVTPSR